MDLKRDIQCLFDAARVGRGSQQRGRERSAAWSLLEEEIRMCLKQMNASDD